MDWFRSDAATFTLEAALDRLAPYYGRTPEIDLLFSLDGKMGRLKYLSQMYCFNSKLVQLIKCHFIPFPEDAGYEALTGSLPKDKMITKDGDGIGLVDPQKVVYLQKLITYMRENDIRLVFVISPRFYQVKDEVYRIEEKVAAEKGIILIDMLNFLGLMSPRYFADDTHLNDTGARKFTMILVGCLKAMMKDGKEFGS